MAIPHLVEDAVRMRDERGRQALKPLANDRWRSAERRELNAGSVEASPEGGAMLYVKVPALLRRS